VTPADVPPGIGPHRSGPGLDAAAYLADLQRAGIKVVPGSGHRHWMGYYESMMRFPRFETGPVAPNELRQVLRASGAKVLSYVLDVGPDRPANAWLYACIDRNFELKRLASTLQRAVRKGNRELTIGPISLEQVLAYGEQAFCESHYRNGIWGANAEQFHRQFRERPLSAAHVYFGAWKGDQLAAFFSIVEVDDWCEIDCSYSRNEYLPLRVNDALMFHVLSHYMRDRQCRLASFGFSSVERTGKEAGLHRFKTKVGFSALPVHRTFTLHPLLRPLINRATLASVTLALKALPRNRILKKTAGLLHCLLDKNPTLPGDEGPDDDASPASPVDPSQSVPQNRR
jgi:hypothetical protein